MFINFQKIVLSGCLIFATASCSHSSQVSQYPSRWWEPIDKSKAASWEILPQEAQSGAVILSKRNELGLLSNFAATPFEYKGVRYASLEGLWQSLLYPENNKDVRAQFKNVKWLYTRDQVRQMVAFEAKKAGDLAKKNMKEMKIDWVTFEGRKMPYHTSDKGEHYQIIYEATREKILQNPRVLEVLLSTGDLKLSPDHHQSLDAPPAWRYYEIAMQLREEFKSRSP